MKHILEALLVPVVIGLGALASIAGGYIDNSAVRVAPVSVTTNVTTNVMTVLATGRTNAYLNTGEDEYYKAGAVIPVPRYTLAGGVVYDAATRLYWVADMTNVNSAYNNAGSFSLGLLTVPYGGYSDWRQPNLNESLSVIDWTQSSAFLLNTNYFVVSTNSGSNGGAAAYWTSSRDTNNTMSAWLINYSRPAVTISTTNTSANAGFTRWVRGP